MLVREGTVAEVVALSRAVPELHDPYPAAVYHEKLAGKPALILIAEVDKVPAGFKVGYEREGFWYSWMGGVLPAHRRGGIARQLADAQDQWAIQRGYPDVTCKTLNRHRNMLYFALKRGFNILRVEPRPTIEEYRIWLRKSYP